jgi:hypothetical protein
MQQVQRERLVARSGAGRGQRCGGPARPSQLLCRPGAPLAGAGDDALDAAGCCRMHRDPSRRNDDAHHATESAASSLHQIKATMKSQVTPAAISPARLTAA